MCGRAAFHRRDRAEQNGKYYEMHDHDIEAHAAAFIG